MLLLWIGEFTLLPTEHSSIPVCVCVCAYLTIFRCYAVGLGVIVSLCSITEVHFTTDINFEALEKMVLSVKDHPALIG